MTIYRRKRAAEQAKNRPDVTGVSAAIFLSGEDGPVTPAGVEGLAERGFASKKAEDFRLRRRRPRWLPTDDDYSHRDQQRMGCERNRRVLADGFRTNSAAWRWIDCQDGETISRAEHVARPARLASCPAGRRGA